MRVAGEEHQMSGGCVGRLVISCDSPPDQRAPDLLHALHALLRRCYPGTKEVFGLVNPVIFQSLLAQIVRSFDTHMRA